MLTSAFSPVYQGILRVPVHLDVKKLTNIKLFFSGTSKFTQTDIKATFTLRKKDKLTAMSSTVSHTGATKDMGKMLGGEEEKDPDAAKKEEERQEALRQQEEERKAKHARMEAEREKVRQTIRDKVRGQQI